MAVKRRPYIGPSESQTEALYRRDHSFSEASGQSFTVKWNFHNRLPTSLSEAVDMVRQAYADEVPVRLHEAAIGEGGTPRMTHRMESWLDDDPRAGHERRDPETCERPALDEYKTPFRACLASYEPNRARVIEHVAIGSMGPVQAAISEGVPRWCARLVAQDTLFGFLRNLSDVKVDLAKREASAA